jgi:hypothetical protein
MYSSTLSLTSALAGVDGQGHAPAALPPGKTRYALYRRLGGLQGRSARVRKISPPPGIDRRTVQPVASHHTDWAIPSHLSACNFVKPSLYRTITGPKGSRRLRTPNFERVGTWRWLRLSVPCTCHLYSPRVILVLISARGWVNPRAIAGREILCQRKIPVTPLGIEPATFRLEEQHT